MEEYRFSKRVSGMAVRHAYSVLKRKGFTGEAERMRLFISPGHFQNMVERKGKRVVIDFGVNAAIREMSNMLRLEWLSAEYNGRVKEQKHAERTV